MMMVITYFQSKLLTIFLSFFNSLATVADDQARKQHEKDGQRLKLLMVTLKEISRKISMMEVMEQDASSMVSRTDVLQGRINDLENVNLMERLQERKPKKTTTEFVAPKKVFEWLLLGTSGQKCAMFIA